MRVTYITRSFLDYRIPVFEALYDKLNGDFRIIYSADYVPSRCDERVRASLGHAAIGMRGEWRLGPNEFADFANESVRIVYQPGIWNAIEKTEPELVIGDGFFQWTSVALAYRIIRPVGLVVCYERTHHTERSVQRLRKLYRQGVLKVVDAMAVNGSLSRDYAISLGMQSDRVTVGQMAADSDRLAERVASVTAGERASIRTKWGTPEIAVVAIGRLNDRKGIRQLLDGWSLLESRCKGNWRLIVVGDGPERASLERRAKELGLLGLVLVGHVNYEDIHRIYAAADVVVMPTLEDNWSLVIPEAMACGLPVLSSVYNGCYPELVRNHENGWLFDPLNPEDTFMALFRCVENASRFKEMGQTSRTIALGFTPERAAESIVKACEIAYGRVNES